MKNVAEKRIEATSTNTASCFHQSKPAKTTTAIPPSRHTPPGAMTAVHQLRLAFDDIVTPEAQDMHFDFEEFLRTDLHLHLTHNKAGALAARHARLASGKAVVCKHWLRGLCKKGDLCEFLHEFNLKKMPECWFYQRLGECTNPECQYLHIDPASKMKECTWYARGFCIHGPNCRGKHVRKGVCQNYLTGFCPRGPECPLGHPKFEVHTLNAVLAPQEIQQQQPIQPRANRPLGEVLCFKCGEHGHYANNSAPTTAVSTVPAASTPTYSNIWIMNRFSYTHKLCTNYRQKEHLAKTPIKPCY
ncbi:hypothetical protein SeMB42_g07082 [Synchytrium endobioticum]|uniref:mRNA 3'-end-processing protein n=1 Tax=Synchytrium endobioticum TaxID=286115 RepID=A0A507C4G6_9FUNG|nr:hypothetical protein SeMB42_g07082 [Synchytrium endobioticum]